VLDSWSLEDRSALTSTAGLETLSTVGLETVSTLGLETVSTLGLETLSSAIVSAAVWNSARASFTVAGSFGEIASTSTAAPDFWVAGPFSTHSTAGLETLSTLGLETLSTAGLETLSSAVVTGAVWDSTRASHVAAGTFGQIVSSSTVAPDIWTSGPFSTHSTAGLETLSTAGLETGSTSVDITSISGSTVAADNIQRGAEGLVLGATAGVPTTTVIGTDLTETTDDHYKGRIVTFTTGALAGQSSDITGYNGTTKELTVTALTDAPAAGVSFVIS